jgi:hypothetical protein
MGTGMGTEKGGVEKEGRDVGSGLGRSGRGRSRGGTAGTVTAEDRDAGLDRAPSGGSSSAKEERRGKADSGATGLVVPEAAKDWSGARYAS